jgi:glycosyltransferase involved in cell wall biosynthesis
MQKITVIIPTYNRASMIRESVASVLRQTFTDFEIIVVDDGSTDNTKAVVESFKDPRIKYIYQENRGASAARNTGIEASSSEYVAFLDSDDVYIDNAIENALKYLELYPDVGFCYGQCHMSRLGGEVYRTRISHFHKKSTVIKPLTQVKELLAIDCPITLSTLTVRRTCLIEIGGFNEDLVVAEDWHVFIKLAKKYPAFYIAEPLTIQRHHNKQLRHLIKPGKEKAFLLCLKEIFEDPVIAPHFSGIKRKTYSNFYSKNLFQVVWGEDMKLARQYLRMAVRYHPQVIVSPHGLRIIYKYLQSLLPEWLRIGMRNTKRRFRYTLEAQESE